MALGCLTPKFWACLGTPAPTLCPPLLLLAQAPLYVAAPLPSVAPIKSGAWGLGGKGGFWSGEPAVLGAAPGWGSRLITINTVGSSVCPALHAAPRGKGWPRANIRRCAPLSPSPAGHTGSWGRGWEQCAEVAWGFTAGLLGWLPCLPGCLLPTPSGS